jgi:GNAT superfamily N-acetyltransferase
MAQQVVSHRLTDMNADTENLLQVVYATSVAWAELGSEVSDTPFGKLIMNPANPDYHERNCAWQLRADRTSLAVTHSHIERHFAARGLTCFNYVPALGQDLSPFEAFFGARGHRGIPSEALVYTGEASSKMLPDIQLVSAQEHPNLLGQVFELRGQRFAGDAVKRAALSLLDAPGYASYVCLHQGVVVGRVGLLVVGAAGRVKSIFVGADFRRLGIASAMLQAVTDQAHRLGCKVVCSEVDADNLASLGCHAKAGFRSVGTMHTFQLA